MKARILALLAMVLGVVSCQTEPEGLDVNVGGEVETTVCVSLPEATRANSAVGAVGTFNNVDWNTYTVRYIMQIFDQNGRASEAKYVAYKDGNENNNNSVTFPVRLVPNRDYNFVVWADIVTDADKTDLHYNLHNGDEGALDLTNITLNNTWVAMDETRDAYTGFYNTEVEGTKYSSSLPINITLKRPFAKLRVITTDMEALRNLAIVPTNAVVKYTTPHYTSFDAFNASYSGEVADVEHEYVIADYADITYPNKVLFTDYFFAAEGDVVKFSLDVLETSGARIKKNDFNTDIAVQRNYLTTIQGNILTEGNNVTVTVEDAFENVENGTTTDPDYDYATISSEKEFMDAIKGTGGNYILISNLNLTGVYAQAAAATRNTTGPKTVNINLNGLTINVNNQTGNALVTLNDGDALIFSGEGTIVAVDGSKKLVEGGNVYVTGTADVDEDVADVKSGAETLKYVVNNGGEFTLTENIEVRESLNATTANDIVINGNDKTIKVKNVTGRFIDVKSDANGANLTLKNLTIENNVSWIERIVNYNTNGNLTLENVKIVNAEGCSNNYAINLPASSDNANVVITDSEIWAGAVALNLWGEKTTANITNSKLYVVDDSAAEGYAVVSLNNGTDAAAHYSVVNVEGGEVKAIYEGEGETQPSSAFRDATVGSVINISETTVVVGEIKIPVANVIYEGYDQFYSFTTVEAAIAKVQKDKNGTVVLIKDLVLTEKINVKASDHMVVLDLNGHNMHMVDTTEAGFEMINNVGKLTIQGEGKLSVEATINSGWNRCSSVISNTVGGNLTVMEGVVIEHLGGTDMAYGIDNLTNGKGTYAVTTIDGATVKSTYSAIRQFLNGVEATNELYVKAGSTLVSPNRSIFFQDPSKNANTGKLVVEAGASVTGDVRLSVTEGSTEWPVKVSVAASALVNGSEVTYGYIPAGYEVVLENGVWVVNAYTEVSTATALQAALANGKRVILSSDLTINGDEMMTAPYGNKMALSQNGGVFNGNGKNISVTAGGDNYVVMTNGGTIKNLDIDRGFRGIMLMYPNQDVYVDNVNIGVDDEVCYTINTGEGEGTNSLYVSNSVLNGWCSIGTAVKYVSFTNCTFGQGTYYTNVYGRLVKPYVDALFDGCEFCSKSYIDLSAFVGTKVTLKNCTVNGVKITAQNWTSLVAPEDTCGEGQISIELKNGTYMTAENVADYVVFE